MRVVLSQRGELLTGVPAHQLSILQRVGVPTLAAEARLPHADLLVDALIGYSLSGAPRSPVSSLIRAANAAGAPILALDVPSGLNGNRGTPYDPCITAASTLTLALPKAGLLEGAAATSVGDLYVADISVPNLVYDRIGVRVDPVFGRNDVVAVR